ncbi:MAG: hypothetical protein JWM54_103 [Acidobacteriaceae bacterium]|nr:hypothetical protein [Acidobacteriaceae bacterium]
MIDFSEVVRRFGADAVRDYNEYDRKHDEAALLAITSHDQPHRSASVRHWLEQYSVLLGFTTQERDDIAEAVVAWVDNADRASTLDTADAIIAAHADLVEHCQNVKKRGYTSLASKALWLRYPEQVPIYDSIAKGALRVVSKLLPGNTRPDAAVAAMSEYSSFVHAWMRLYEGSAAALAEIEGCKYRSRVLDAILLQLGEDIYWITQ